MLLGKPLFQCLKKWWLPSRETDTVKKTSDTVTATREIGSMLSCLLHFVSCKIHKKFCLNFTQADFISLSLPVCHLHFCKFCRIGKRMGCCHIWQGETYWIKSHFFWGGGGGSWILSMESFGLCLKEPLKTWFPGYSTAILRCYILT